MATVHLARLMGHEGFSRTVAVKQLHPQFSHDPEFVAMFLDEARLASRVRHPNVVSPLDVISCPPELFIVMEYVHGASLARLLKRVTPVAVPARVAAAIVGQILLGLHAAHEATGEGGEPLELVHRDVSPQNIMVTKDGVARIVDFGIAKAKDRSHQTDPGKLKGKLGYMAPEQVNLQNVDRRADVFAVGVVLWELLCGRRLFSSDSPAASVQKLLNAEIEPPSRLVPVLSSALDEVVLRALARPVGERFENARAMAEALERAVAPCSMLELATWVESLVGEELEARSELMFDVESLRFEDFTQALALPLGATPLEAPRFASSGEGRLDRDGSPPKISGMPTDHGSGRLRKGWILPIAVTVTIVGFVLWGRTQRAVTGAVTPIVAAHAALPAPLSVNATLRTPIDAAPVDAPLPEPLHGDAAAIAVEGAAIARGIGSSRASVKTVASGRSKPAKDCDVPYVIDKSGVKRFKEACF